MERPAAPVGGDLPGLGDTRSGMQVAGRADRQPFEEIGDDAASGLSSDPSRVDGLGFEIEEPEVGWGLVEAAGSEGERGSEGKGEAEPWGQSHGGRWERGTGGSCCGAV